MSGGLNRLLAASAVAVAVLVAAPPAALACNGGPSAVNVYRECLSTGGGAKPTNSPPASQKKTGPTRVSAKTAKALRQAGKDGRALSTLVNGFGTTRLPEPSGSSSVSAPSALGSAFDLGSGPLALLIALAGTAVVLLAGSGLRVWRHRHRA